MSKLSPLPLPAEAPANPTVSSFPSLLSAEGVCAGLLRTGAKAKGRAGVCGPSGSCVPHEQCAAVSVCCLLQAGVFVI